jgi:Tol biopolymer transport system component
VSAAISPDGRQAVVAQDAGQPPVRRLHLLDLERGVLTRFTPGDVDERTPVWAPNGSSIAFHSRRDKASGIYRRGAGGGATTDELLWQTDEAVTPSGFSSDGQRLLFTRGTGFNQRLWMLPLSGDRTPAQLFPGSTMPQLWAKFSPDDKWIVYQEGPSPSPADNQIYVQPSPPDGRRVQISTAGGRNPVWSYDGRHIMYRDADDAIVTVALTFDGGTIRPSTPRPVFARALPGNLGLSYTGDTRAERLLLIRPPDKPVEDASSITVIVNFAQSVAKK